LLFTSRLVLSISWLPQYFSAPESAAPIFVASCHHTLQTSQCCSWLMSHLRTEVPDREYWIIMRGLEPQYYVIYAIYLAIYNVFYIAYWFNPLKLIGWPE